MEKILVSACLLGDKTRYDGKDNLFPFLEKLQKKYELIPFCPEMEAGLGVPRDPAEISHNQVITKNGKDLTKEYTDAADKAVRICKFLGISMAILKDGSPACGPRHIHDGKFDDLKIEGLGVTARLLIAAGIKVYCETDSLDFLLEEKEDHRKSPIVKEGSRYSSRAKSKREAYFEKENSSGTEGAPKDYGNRDGYHKSYGDRKSYGEHRSYGDRKPYGEHRSYGDRKPYDGERKSYGDKPYGERKSYGDRKPYGEHRSYGDRKPYDGERKPYGDKPYGERKSYGERKPYGEKRTYGDRKPYDGERKSYGDKPYGERKSYGDRKPYGEHRSYGDRKPYGEHKSYGERKPYGDKPSFGDKKPYDGERKPYGERKSYGHSSYGDHKSYGGRKPYGERKSYGERKPYGARRSYKPRTTSGDKKVESTPKDTKKEG